MTEVVKELEAMGVTVTSVVADNARNMQKGLTLSSKSGFITGNCVAHTLQLLLSDLMVPFKVQFDQMSEVETFFRIR